MTQSPFVPRELRHLDRLAEVSRTLSSEPIRSDDAMRSIVITSPIGGEGVTTLSTCLALGLARDRGESTLWIDCSTIEADRAHTPPGLGEVMRGQARVAEAIHATESLPDLHMLSAGRSPVPLSISSMFERFQSLLEQLRDGYRFVILDTPPVLSGPTTRVLLEGVDASVLVVREGRSLGPDVQRSTEFLRAAGASFLGSILNASDRGRSFRSLRSIVAPFRRSESA